MEIAIVAMDLNLSGHRGVATPPFEANGGNYQEPARQFPDV
jgi:hypothetical protein